MELLQKLWKVLKPFHKVFGWYIALIVLYETLQIIEGYAMPAAVRLFSADTKLLIWAIFIGGLVVFDELFMRLDNNLDWYIVTKQLNPIFKHLRIEAVKKFLGLDMPWHQKNNSGVLVGKVNTGVDKINSIVNDLSWEFTPSTTQALLSIPPLLIFSPFVVLVFIVALPVYLWVSIIGLRKREPLRKKRHDLYEDDWRDSVETVQNLETVLIFGQKQRILDKYIELHNEIISIGTKEVRTHIFTYNRWRQRILSVARRSILVIWVYQLYNGTLDIAGLIFVNVLTEKLFNSFWRLTRLFERLMEASEGAKRLADLLDQKPAIPGHIKDFDLRSPIGIRMVGVNFSYPGRKKVIRNLNLEIEQGQVVAFVGKTGAGKTTIRRLITRQFELNSGEIYFDGSEIKGWGTDDLAKYYSCVPQGDDVGILDDTIRNNIAFPRMSASQEEVERVAKLSGIHDFIVNELPKGYNSIVGERGQKLSGGQKQRVALARAILDDKPVLFLDEATNAVDAITEEWIQRELKKLFKGKTVIVIAHRLSTIWDIADKIIVLDGGEKIEEGTHSELMKAGGLYAEMVKLQVGNNNPK